MSRFPRDLCSASSPLLKRGGSRRGLSTEPGRVAVLRPLYTHRIRANCLRLGIGPLSPLSSLPHRCLMEQLVTCAPQAPQIPLHRPRGRSGRIRNRRFACRRALPTRLKILLTVAATLQLAAALLVHAPRPPIWMILPASDGRIPGSRHMCAKVIPSPVEDTAAARHNRLPKIP